MKILKIDQQLLNNQFRKREVTYLYRQIYKSLPNDRLKIRQQLNENIKLNNIKQITLQINTLRAFYQLILNSDYLKINRILNKQTQITNELIAIQKLEKYPQFQLLNQEDQIYIKFLLRSAVKDNNDQVKRRFPTLYDYIISNKTEKYHAKYKS